MVRRRSGSAARKTVLVVVVLAVFLVSGFVAYMSFVPTQGCQGANSARPAKYQAAKVQFGAVTEYCLASPSRWPNAVTVARDGSVWFAEWSVPGVGHLFSNGTVVEYPWPTAAKSGSVINGSRTETWGIAVWNGRIWASNQDENALMGVDPNDRSTIVINTTGRAPEPYTLTAAPDGSLWFTSLSNPAKLGRVASNLSVTIFSLQGLGREDPLQVEFVNSTYAYVAALNPFSPTGVGHIYSFNPQQTESTITPAKVGGDYRLLLPDSVSAAGSSVWVAQHIAASVARYDTVAGSWTIFPTSTVSYLRTTLPYFIEASGSIVWFNEHYANKIARLDSGTATLTEYSESDPPIDKANSIQNDLTIALANGRLWFTSTTGNYIGFVDGNYRPSFAIYASGANSAILPRNGTVKVQLQVSGTWSDALQVHVSDSENYTSIPSLISIQPDHSSVPPGSGPSSLSVTLGAKPNLQPGRYTLAVTVTAGLVSQTAYIFLTVT